jgi:hypothetical protein
MSPWPRWRRAPMAGARAGPECRLRSPQLQEIRDDGEAVAK